LTFEHGLQGDGRRKPAAMANLWAKKRLVRRLAAKKRLVRRLAFACRRVPIWHDAERGLPVQQLILIHACLLLMQLRARCLVLRALRAELSKNIDRGGVLTRNNG